MPRRGIHDDVNSKFLLLRAGSLQVPLFFRAPSGLQRRDDTFRSFVSACAFHPHGLKRIWVDENPPTRMQSEELVVARRKVLPMVKLAVNVCDENFSCSCILRLRSVICSACRWPRAHQALPLVAAPVMSQASQAARAARGNSTAKNLREKLEKVRGKKASCSLHTPAHT